MSTAVIIFNPHAGTINLAAQLELVADTWRARGWEIKIWPTEAAGHATQLARYAAHNGKQLVIAAGGDGTLGEVANGLAGTETIMAPLPVGTANSFAREVGLPMPSPLDRTQLLKASDLLAAGRVQRMDLGYTPQADAGKQHWLLWAGVGVDSYAVNKIEPRPAWLKKLGTLGYAVQGAVVSSQYSHVTAQIEVDGRSFSGDYILILISNCRNYAGVLTINPDSALDDGFFEVWLFKGKGLPKLSFHLMNVWRGAHVDASDVECVNGRSVKITTDSNMPVQTDGDPTGSTPFACEIKPSALRLLVPANLPPGLFTQAGKPLNMIWDQHVTK